MTAPADRVIPLPSPALPVPRGTVAVLRLPISGGGLDALNLALVEAYGLGLEVVIEGRPGGWMVVARKDDPVDLDSVRASRAAGGR